MGDFRLEITISATSHRVANCCLCCFRAAARHLFVSTPSTFQLNAERRKRLHLHCDALKAQGINVFNKSKRGGGIRKLMVTLPNKKRAANSAQPTDDAKSGETVEPSSAALDVGSAASIFDLG